MTTTELPTDQIDLWDASLFLDGPPHTIFDALRDSTPLYWSPRADDPDGGFWSVFRFDDVHALSRDQLRLTSTKGFSAPRRTGDHGPFADNIMFRDPPAHTAHRKPLNRRFTPKAMTEIESIVRRVVGGVLDELEDRPTFDWVPDVAAEIPARVVAGLVGVPEEDHHCIVDWASDVFTNDGSPEGEARFNQAVHGMLTYASDLMSSRRAHPTDDIMSLLLTSEVEGAPLTDNVLRMWFLTLVGAGFETTHTLIAQSAVLLDRMPEVRQQLMEDRRLVARAIEELLRFVTPVNFMARTATTDFELHGQTIREGQYVCMWYSAANRDPAMFADPHRFIIDREPNPHQAFGAAGSPHYCLGAHLARLETRLLLEELADREFPYRLDGQTERLGSVFMNALKHVPVTRS